MILRGGTTIPKVRARQIQIPTLAHSAQGAKYLKKDSGSDNKCISETPRSLQLCKRYKVPLDLGIPNFRCGFAAPDLFVNSKAESGPTHF
jgi:hypothetical protein